MSTLTNGKMQLWNYYSTDGSQANKKLHSSPVPKGRFDKNAPLFFGDRPKSYHDHLNFAIAKSEATRYIPFKETLALEDHYSSSKINMALNYFYHSNSLYFNSTILTDFSGPTIDLKYENFAEGSYKFAVSLKN